MVIEIIVKLIIQSIRYLKDSIDTLIIHISQDMSFEKIFVEIWSWMNDILDPLQNLGGG
jgi:hypothetical protein